MTTQLSNTTAILVSDTTAQNYYQGGTFQLGGGPFEELTFSAEDDDDKFTSFGANYDESNGAGRQTGTLTDGSGTPYDSGLTSLEDVLLLTHPTTGEQIMVGRVSMREDTGASGGGGETQDFYIFSAPIDPNVAYNVSAIDYTPGGDGSDGYAYSTFDGGGVVCFTAGTLIKTARGLCRAEDIRPGDRVQTTDHGLKPVVWAGQRRFDALDLARDHARVPVRIAAGALGNEAPLMLSQQHRVVVGDCFIKAKDLVRVAGCPARFACGVRAVTYVHILLAEHAILFAGGVHAESLFIGAQSKRLLRNGMLGHVAREVGEVEHGYLARPVLRGAKALKFVSRHLRPAPQHA